MLTSNYTPTPEFSKAVSSGNLLNTRIMLKNSMVVDPTGKQFWGMLEYAKRKLPGIIVPHDGEELEPDPAKWNQELMDLELGQLVDNFSNERISHLWQIIRKNRADDIRRREYMEKVQQRREAPPTGRFSRSSGSSVPKSPGPAGLSESEKKQNRSCALADMRAGGEDIEQIMRETEHGRKWRASQVDQMKQAAQKILSAVERYERNR